jgi:hypothetical protein
MLIPLQEDRLEHSVPPEQLEFGTVSQWLNCRHESFFADVL